MFQSRNTILASLLARHNAKLSTLQPLLSIDIAQLATPSNITKGCRALYLYTVLSSNNSATDSMH